MPTNHNQFIDASTGTEVCPSGCPSFEACVNLPLIASLAETSERLQQMTSPEAAGLMYAVRGDHVPIRTASESRKIQEQLLSSTCLRYHLIQTGELTNDD